MCQYSDKIESYKKDLELACLNISRLHSSIELDKNLSESDKKELLKKISHFYPSKFINQKMIGSVIKDNYGSSYQSSLVSLIKVKMKMRNYGLVIAPGGNNKDHDRAFAQALDIKVPKRYHNSVPFENLEFIENSVIKPISGSSSRNVFYILDGEILEVKNKEKYSDLSSLYEKCSGRVGFKRNGWVQEELIRHNKKPARDIKLFCFYGEVGVILEVDRVMAGSAVNCFYDGDGNLIDIGQKNVKSFSGDGVSPEVVEYAKKISLNSPVPFLRIDFYRGDSGYYLGEITPHPGWHAGERSDEWDYKLGEMFDAAWARLYIDMLNGKKFVDYFESYSLQKNK